MQKFSGVLAAASLALGAAACASNGFAPVAITKSPTAVASCEKVGDISVKAGGRTQEDATTLLTREARDKGANTVLVAEDNADKGTAYRCSMPSMASTSKSGSAPAH
jgi:hypothetical protein